MSARVLVAGIGNVFLGDDGFGCEVVRRLRAESLGANVSVIDYGIRGLHLAYDLLDPPTLLVIVDALGGDAPPGTVFVLDPDLDALPPGDSNPHGMDLPAVFTQVRALGGALGQVRVVGCVPETIEERIGLSDVVAAAVETAAQRVRALLAGRALPEQLSNREVSS
jgi:hydrogenase maturation protease